MGYLKSLSAHHPSIKKCLMALAVCGLMFPGASVAQTTSETTSINAPRTVLADGTYLFGQSENRDELGMTYAVFSVQDNKTVGAFYQPRSSFDCFSGHLTPTELAVNIVDSYSQVVYPYEVAVTLDDILVAGQAAGAYTLDGFHQISALSDKDREILAVCQADFAQ